MIMGEGFQREGLGWGAVFGVLVESIQFDSVNQYYFTIRQVQNSAMVDKSQAYYNNYKALKSNTTLPLKIKLFYSLLEEAIHKYNNTTSGVSKDQTKKYKYFVSGFKRLSEEEQCRYLAETLKFVKHGLIKEGKKDDSGSSEGDNMDFIKDIETSCKVKESFLGFTKWEKKCFKLNTKIYKIKLVDGKKEVVFPLAFYFIRKSIKHSKTLTLFANSENVQPSRSEVYISFDSSQVFEEIYNLIFSCMIELQAKEILQLVCQQQKSEHLITLNDDMAKASVILTTKVLNEYFQHKNKVIKKLQDPTKKFQPLQLGFQSTKVSICRQKNKDRIKIQKSYNLDLKKLQKYLTILNHQCDDKLIQFEILETFSTNINVVYFKYFYNQQVYQFLTIMEQNYRDGEHNIFFKGVDNFISQQFVDFLCFRIKQIPNNHVVLELMGIIKKEQKNNSQAVGFLLSLIQPRVAQESGRSVKLEEFWTVREMDGNEMDYVDEYYGNGLQNQQAMRRSRRFSQQQSKTLNKCLFRKSYMLAPSQQSPNKYLTSQPLFMDFKLHKSGGVYCTNEQQINHQKKVFKYIISQIGSNIIARKNILNVSFPVTIFKKESQLKSIARNYASAPIFFQKVVDAAPEEKMKAVVLFQISTSLSVISMNKPFNPVLGETYQGFIDGCPIFLEQISHHPPISSYLFYGRGYTMFGAVEPKIAIGLNCVKGWSPLLNHIHFDDGTKIDFTINKMVINGMLFGQRTFNFQGINYATDHTNKIMSQICYGIQSNTTFKKKDLTYDSVSGSAYKLKLNTLNGQKITTQIFKKCQKDKIFNFIGTWHSDVQINGDVVYNFTKGLPHQLIDYEAPIPSDSVYRTDLIALEKGDLEGAQKEKDFIEEIQRRDKKLREAYKKSQRIQ